MQTFSRIQKRLIIQDFFKGKIILIIGARQVGKTTLTEQITHEFKDKKILKLNADNPSDSDLLRNKDFEQLKVIIADNEIVIIDEAQRIENIGITLKLLVDNYKGSKQIIATGSSSINLLESTAEPLTGRKFTYHLYPISLEELLQSTDILMLQKSFDSFLRFGMYPEILKTENIEDKKRLLQELTSSYLFKDILEFQDIKNPKILNDLLKALALQIGSEVSYSELSKMLGIDSKTVERYVDLLEKNFIVFRLQTFSTNKRREISRNKKVLFYDLGIRNALLDNFNTLDKRTDLGHLWENFVIAERLKFREYHRIHATQNFWRTYDGSEIDLVEEREGSLFGYEIKYSQKGKKAPLKWSEYENSSYKVINKENLAGFLF